MVDKNQRLYPATVNQGMPRAETPDSGTNCLMVHVMHYPHDKSVRLSVGPAEDRPDGFKMVLMSDKMLRLEQLPRKNQKVVDQLANEAFAQIESKSGRAWDFAQTVLTAYGMTLAG